MSAPAAKRARADSNGAAITPHHENLTRGLVWSSLAARSGSTDPASVRRLVEKLPDDQLESLLIRAAVNHPDVLESIRSAIRAELFHTC